MSVTYVTQCFQSQAADFYDSSVSRIQLWGGVRPCLKGTISFKLGPIIILYIVRTRFQSTWQYSRKISASSLNIYRISLDLIHISLNFNFFRLATLHIRGTEQGYLEGDALTGREDEFKYCFSFEFFILFIFILYYFLPSGGGSVPFVLP